MKFSNLKKAALLVLTGSGLLTAAVNAATYSAGDLLLGVRASGGTGATSDIVINLGPASNFTGASTSSTVINIDSDLSTQFGSWASRTDVFFGISGTSGGSTVGSDGPKTLYATSAEITTGTLTTPWARGSFTAQGLATNKMSAMATALTQGATATTATNGVVQTTTDTNSYASYQNGGTLANSGNQGGTPPGGTSFAYFTPSIEGTPGQRLDLYRSVAATGGAVGTPSQFVGYFELSGSGDLTFTPAAAVSTATVSIAQTAYSLLENDASGKITVTVVRGGGLSGSASVTLDTTAGSAVAGTDYTTTSQLVSFAANETTKTVDVPIANRSGYQGNRVFYVGLSSATGASVIAPGTSVPVTILESDPAVTLGSSPSALLTTYGTASSPSSFVVSGSNLTANLTVTPPAGFEVSTSSSSGFGSTVTLTPSSGTVSSLAVYIRLAATTNAGTYSGNVTISGGGLASNATLATTSSTVSKAYLSISSPVASSKTYDGTNAATITGTLTGILNSDNVTLVGTGTFPSAALGTGLAVTSTSTLGGTAAGNYQLLSQPTGLTANITAAPLTITGLTGVNKVYDGTTSASFTGTPAYSGLASGETFSVTGTPSATFATATAGTAKSITVTGFTAPSSNYTVTQPALTANITAAPLTITGLTGANKVYDGTTSASFTGTAAYSGLQNGETFSVTGTPSATFATATAGTAKSITVTGFTAPSGNYTVTQPTGLTGSITTAPLTITGLSGNNKSYDGTTTATLGGTAAYSGLVNSESFSVTGTISATFASASVGTGKAITVTGITAPSGNYTVSQPTGLTANITAAPLTITGLSGTNKTYDGGVTATLGGTAAYSGLVNSESFSVSGTPSATFATKVVGTGKAITVTGYTAPSGNYTVSQPTGLTANITAKTLTVNSPAVTDHAFDGGTTAVITGTLSGVISPDVVTFNGTGTFASSGVGTGIAVISTSTLGGADAGNYTFTQLTGLTGNIVNSSVLTLSQSVYTVTCSATATTVVNIQVNRSDTSGAFTATLATANGTGIAGTAAGTQYVALTGTGNVSFTAAGSASQIIPVTINKSATTTTAKTFTVTLSGLSAGAGLGTPSTATVVILPPTADATKPTVTITSPVNNSTLNDLAPLTISGTVGDNVGISSLVVTLNGTPHTVTLATPTSTTYSLSGLTPQTGTNTITVTATDFNSNTTTTATTTFTQLRTLTVNAAIASASVAGGTVTAGFAPSSQRQVGKSLTITATPSTTFPTANGGSIFNGWTVSGATNAEIGIAASALEKQTITFNFKEGMTLTANFVANPYKALAGTYNGLVKSSTIAPTIAGTAPSNSTEGFFNALVTSTGGFSGKLTIDTVVLSMAGVFDGNGNARFGTARTLSLIVPSTNGKPSFILDTVHIDTATAKITAKVTSTSFLRSQVTAVSNISADLAYYDGMTKIVPAVYLGAANANGVFTVAFPSVALGSQPARIAAASFANGDYPQGDGVGMITVTKAGVVSLTGTLADGTPVTASSTLPKAVGATNVINFALFAKLYSNLGFLSAPVTFDDTQNNTDLAATSGSVLWSKPAQSVQYYPHGWPEVITVDLMGAKYTAPAGQSVFKAPSGANLQAPDADGNATLTLSDGQLTENLTKNVNVSTANAVTIPTGDSTFTMTIAPVTGLITGTFTHTDDTKPSYTAVILQKGPSAGGAYGYFLTNKPAVIDYSGESGGVSLIGTP